ncbi:hypothetical protein DV735_g4450, partial [Chaetothyriales sp. CBS 134920]
MAAPYTLLTLPYEIRQRIYELTFASTPTTLKIFEVGNFNFFYWWRRREPEYRWTFTAPTPYSLLDTCQQIRDEALPVLRRRLMVLCEISRDAAQSNNAVIPIRSSVRNSIRYLHLVVHSEFTFWPRNDMSQLLGVLVEATYKPVVILQGSGGGVPDVTPTAIIKAVKSWHLDLLDEPEIPDSPGSWGMLQAMLHPDRPFRLEWKGGIVVHYPILFTSVEVSDIHFDWDSQLLVTGEDEEWNLREKLFG